MLLCGRAGAGGARNGRVSRRYIRMKPNMRESPIHACGVLLVLDSAESPVGAGAGTAGLEGLSSLRMPISPGLVGVTGGILCVWSGSTPSMVVPSGMTGPGRALKGL